MADTDPALEDLRAQWARLRRRKATIFPHEFRLPRGRRVYMTAMAKSIGRSYRVGEVLQHFEVWLDHPPHGVPEDTKVGQRVSFSGTTCVVRVQ